MPTPARWATAEIGALGSATNTSLAAARIRPSLRAASARRPLRGTVEASAVVPRSLLFFSILSAYHALNGTVRSVTLLSRNRPFRSKMVGLARPEEGGALDGRQWRGRDTAVPDRGTADRSRRPARPFGPHALARRAARRRVEPRCAARLLRGARRVLAHHLRLARVGSEAQRIPTVHHDCRRPERPLPARALARDGRAPVGPQPRLARLGCRVSRRYRAAHRPE